MQLCVLPAAAAGCGCKLAQLPPPAAGHHARKLPRCHPLRACCTRLLKLERLLHLAHMQRACICAGVPSVAPWGAAAAAGWLLPCCRAAARPLNRPSPPTRSAFLLDSAPLTLSLHHLSNLHACRWTGSWT